ncbi:MAG TPA: hypothetical protein PKK33_10245, partial [Candidatus Cloacimonadota bacterium]|nr:hypothetical protein [Candidatus Cloacimonadota bacterium]
MQFHCPSILSNVDSDVETTYMGVSFHAGIEYSADAESLLIGIQTHPVLRTTFRQAQCIAFPLYFVKLSTVSKGKAFFSALHSATAGTAQMC